MKALSFLEWHDTGFKDVVVKKKLSFADGISLIQKVANFYNQKFDVGFLVNQKFDFEPLDAEANYEYQQAESLRLFDGWRSVDSRYEIEGHQYMGFYFYGDILKCVNLYEDDTIFSFKYHTLNDFITLCNLAGINLSWNNNNETIKKIFYE